MRTYEEQLEEVQEAISAIVGGAQSYTIGSRSVTKANLAELQKRERYLMTMVARAGDGGRSLVAWPRR